MTHPEDDLAPETGTDPGAEPDLEPEPADAGYLASGDRDPEAPTADAAEQSAPVQPVAHRLRTSRGFEVGEWDAMEQSIVIELEDDYDR